MAKTAAQIAKIIEKTEWSPLIKARANHTCELCGDTVSQMHSHHIEAKGSIALRVSLDNGVCLCAYCHMCIHGINGITKQKERIELLEKNRDLSMLKPLRHKPPRMTRDELLELRKEYKELLTELQ